MLFEWDAEKARRNLVKHKVAFNDAELVWSDPLHVVLPDRAENGEERWHALGSVNGIILLLVVHMYPDPDDDRLVRIISARRATKDERRRYEQGT